MQSKEGAVNRQRYEGCPDSGAGARERVARVAMKDATGARMQAEESTTHREYWHAHDSR